MKTRLLLALPLALAALGLAPSAATAAPAGELVLALGKSRGQLNLGATVHFGSSYGHRSRSGAFVGVWAPPPAPRRIWVPAFTEVVHERVYVPGATRQVWVPPRYGKRTDPCGRRVRVELSPGHWRTEREPGRWETVARTVHHPGHWGWRA